MIKFKLAKSNAIINRASKYLDTFSLKILYCSLFMPYLSYFSEIWGKTYRVVTVVFAHPTEYGPQRAQNGRV